MGNILLLFYLEASCLRSCSCWRWLGCLTGVRPLAASPGRRSAGTSRVSIALLCRSPTLPPTTRTSVKLSRCPWWRLSLTKNPLPSFHSWPLLLLFTLNCVHSRTVHDQDSCIIGQERTTTVLTWDFFLRNSFLIIIKLSTVVYTYCKIRRLHYAKNCNCHSKLLGMSEKFTTG